MRRVKELNSGQITCMDISREKYDKNSFPSPYFPVCIEETTVSWLKQSN